MRPSRYVDFGIRRIAQPFEHRQIWQNPGTVVYRHFRCPKRYWGGCRVALAGIGFTEWIHKWLKASSP
jgi:hypothetical protein